MTSTARSLTVLWLAVLALLASSAFGPAALAQIGPRAGASVTTPHLRAELVADAPQGISPGATVWVGLLLQHEPQWHTYWKNPGDSGLATELAWSLPPGVTSGEVAWPLPHRIPIGSLVNFGYEERVLLPVPLTISPAFDPSASLTGVSTLDIRLKASWLVCKLECIPEEGDFLLKMPVTGSSVAHRAEFDAARAAVPVALDARGTAAVADNALQIRLEGLPSPLRGKALDFFPETGEVIRNAALAGKGWQQSWQGDAWTATVPLSDQRSASPASMTMVVALAAADRVSGEPFAWRTEVPVTGNWPNAAPRAAVSAALQSSLDANIARAATRAPDRTFAAALLGALLGGLLLNLMPCVFPVLAIKVLGFTRHADDRRGHRIAALAYSAGVVSSLLLLGGAMLALRAAGAQLGWGFQLQSPWVVALLAALFTVIGLNLAGMFEFGNLAPSSVRGAQARHPVVNDFLSGVLAVVVASPCTAPFMGVSLGLAVGLPPAQALLLFAALGLGLALPYLVAGFVPAVARLLPRPGPWMETLRRLLAFPIFATVAWLVWVLGQQSGIDGAGALLGMLVGLSAIVWALTLRGGARLTVACLSIAMTAAMAVTVGGNIVRPVEPARTATASDRWQPWSSSRAQELVAGGTPVFIDYTAAWCVTCQFNKHNALSDPALLADFDARKVATLRADWTRRDPAITAALTALGRSGVPVYVLLAPGKAPVVLSEILSAREVRDALASL